MVCGPKLHSFTLSEYLEKRKRLQTPSEQARLLETFPIVSPEISELSPNSEDSIDDEKIYGNSIIQSASTVCRVGWEENEISDNDRRGSGYFPETKQPLLKRSGLGESQRICIPDHEFKPLLPASEEKRDTPETCHSGEVSHMSSEKVVRKGLESTPMGVIELSSDDENASDREGNLIPVNQKDDILKGGKRCIYGSKDENDKYLVSVMCTEETHSEKAARKGQESTPIGAIELLRDDLGKNGKLENYYMPGICHEESQYEPATRKSQESTQIEVVELLSDDENGNDSRASSIPKDQNFNNLESETWCMRGPNGEQEKWPISMLKRWSEISPCAFKFKVWKEEQNEEDAIWLGDAINFAFSKQ